MKIQLQKPCRRRTTRDGASSGRPKDQRQQLRLGIKGVGGLAGAQCRRVVCFLGGMIAKRHSHAAWYGALTHTSIHRYGRGNQNPRPSKRPSGPGGGTGNSRMAGRGGDRGALKMSWALNTEMGHRKNANYAQKKKEMRVRGKPSDWPEARDRRGHPRCMT